MGQSTSQPSGPRAGATGHVKDSFTRSLYDEYSKPLLAVVTRLTSGDRHWAEDVLQETLLRAWRHADRLRPELGVRSLMPWLVTVARRIVINDVRSRGARPHEVDQTLLAMAAVPDDTERLIQRMVLSAALATLGPAHRTVVIEMYLRDRTVQEVARIVGIPPGTVKSRAFNALRLMRAAVQRACPACGRYCAEGRSPCDQAPASR